MCRRGRTHIHDGMRMKVENKKSIEGKHCVLSLLFFLFVLRHFFHLICFLLLFFLPLISLYQICFHHIIPVILFFFSFSITTTNFSIFSSSPSLPPSPSIALACQLRVRRSRYSGDQLQPSRGIESSYKWIKPT